MAKNKGGRPTKFSKEHVAAADDYLVTFNKDGDVIPTIEGLADRLGVVTKTIYNWVEAEVDDEFLHTVGVIAEKQKRILLNSGLKGEFNSQITKLCLHNHGMSDKVDTDVTSAGKRIKNNWTILPVTNDKDG